MSQSAKLQTSQKMIKEFRIKATQLLMGTCIALMLIHALVVYTLLGSNYAEGPFYAVYFFFLPVTLLGFHLIAKQFEKDQQSGTRNFIIYIFVKMLGSLLFLLPWMVLKSPYFMELAYQFLALFFPLLFVETILLIRMINLYFDDNVEKR